jgi:protein SCO1
MRRLMRRTVLVAVVALVAGCGREPRRPAFQATDITGVGWGGDFHLTDHHGRARSLEDFRGKAVMLFFGYTHCPDMCPSTLAKMAAVVEQLDPQGQQVQGLFVTVDPKRDTQEVLTQYVPALHPTFVGLRADEETTAATAREFKVFYQAQKPDERGNYTVDHMGGIFVFDPGGRLRLYVRPESSVDAIVHDLRELLESQ